MKVVEKVCREQRVLSSAPESSLPPRERWLEYEKRKQALPAHLDSQEHALACLSIARGLDL